MVRRTRRPTLNSFLDLEAQFNDLLSRQSILSELTEEEIEARLAPRQDMVAIEREIEAIIGQIKDICSQMPLDVSLGRLSEFSDYGELFVSKLCRRWRSLEDYLEYGQERNRLLVHLTEINVEKQRKNLGKNNQQRHRKTANRNIELAQEFLRRRKQGSHLSDCALKEDIGRSNSLVDPNGGPVRLSRTTSIDAIDDGLGRLGKR
jgi:hypothetical protein